MLPVSSTDGVRLAVHELGGEGRPLLLAHATGFHGLVWEPLAAQLSTRFRRVALDFRGHGASTPPARGYDWHGFADDVLAVVDRLALDRPYAVGHSKGGAALLLAEAARPGTFRALYCYEPVVLPFDPPLGPQPDNPLAVGARRRREVFPSRADAERTFASKPPLGAFHPDALAAYVEHGFEDVPPGPDGGGGVRLRCRPDDEAEIYAMGTEHDAFARLAEVRCPVVLAGGERTREITPALLEQQAGPLPRARVEVLAGLGHFGPLEDPDAVAASVARAFAAG